ncbi:hypothetical protein [Microbacterium lacticum]
MGPPDGWVTEPDLGLTLGEQFTAFDNGVAPARAIHASGALGGVHV